MAGGGSRPQMVQFNLRSTDPEALLAAVEKTRDAMKRKPGLRGHRHHLAQRQAAARRGDRPGAGRLLRHPGRGGRARTSAPSWPATRSPTSTRGATPGTSSSGCPPEVLADPAALGDHPGARPHRPAGRAADDRQGEGGARPVADRAPGPDAPGDAARRPAQLLARRGHGLPRRLREEGAAALGHHRLRGAGARAGRRGQGLRARAAARRRARLHHPGRAVREPHPPLHHHDVAPLRGHRRHRRPARHRPVHVDDGHDRLHHADGARHQERHPAGRVHQPAARRRQVHPARRCSRPAPSGSAPSS